MVVAYLVMAKAGKVGVGKKVKLMWGGFSKGKKKKKQINQLLRDRDPGKKANRLPLAKFVVETSLDAANIHGGKREKIRPLIEEGLMYNPQSPIELFARRKLENEIRRELGSVRSGILFFAIKHNTKIVSDLENRL